MKELILNFHGVGAMPDWVGPQEAAVWWDENSFLTALDDVSAAASMFAHRIALTFDDGNASDAEIALPALVKRSLTATFFVCAGRIGSPNYLASADIAKLLQGGMTIGSHGMNHINWRRASDRELEYETEGARKRLEDICGQRIDVVAIPFGSYDRRVIAQLRRSQWRCVYSSDGGFARSSAWFKPRQTLIRALGRAKTSSH